MRRARMPLPPALLRGAAPERTGPQPARSVHRGEEPPAQPPPARVGCRVRPRGLVSSLRQLRAPPAGSRDQPLRRRHHRVPRGDGRRLQVDQRVLHAGRGRVRQSESASRGVRRGDTGLDSRHLLPRGAIA